MTKPRTIPWDSIVPVAIIACGITVMICNAFPYVHRIPSGLGHPGGYADDPPYDSASAGDRDTNLWASFLQRGFSSVGGFAVIVCSLVILLGFVKLFMRHKVIASRILNGSLFLVALLGLLFTWLLGLVILNDTSDLVTFLPAALVTICSYAAILCILIALALHTLAQGFQE